MLDGPEEAVYDAIALSADHLHTLLTNGGSHFVLDLGEGMEKPFEMDLHNPIDLRTCLRFFTRHLCRAYNDMKEARDIAEATGEDLVSIITETIDSDFAALDRDKSRLFQVESEQEYRNEHPELFNDLDFLPPPGGLFDND